ncbi:MAG TPA: endonuclease NucS domain-containing protein [archaeon]|nr:endonuclease NucS domain-containing protein [archaeon]HLD80501.1 endonuclease NucS domain-containing protein [archaeon]
MELLQAKERVDNALLHNNLLVLVGVCTVKYLGRAASTLPKGKRVLMVKSDHSVALHQNEKVRPINYMLSADISCKLDGGVLEIFAKNRKNAEKLHVDFSEVEFVQAFELKESHDLRLVGSEKHLSDELAKDLSFIEPGLTPRMRENPLRKGRIDLLAEDARGNLVIIEVKRRDADLSAVNQLKMYVDQVANLKGRKTRGILIAPGIMKSAKELLDSLKLEFRRIDFEMSEKSAKIKGLESQQKSLGEFS